MPRTPTLQTMHLGLLKAVRDAEKPLLFAKTAPVEPPALGVPPGGVGLRGVPRGQPAAFLPDWLERQVKRADLSMEGFLARDFYFAVHWPTFLRDAFSKPSDVAELAQRFWKHIRTLIRGADPVLAQYLEDSANQPHDVITFHIEKLLLSPFRKKLIGAMREAYRFSEYRAGYKSMQRCTACLERDLSLLKAGSAVADNYENLSICPACVQRKAFADECLLVSIDVLMHPRENTYTTQSMRELLGYFPMDRGDRLGFDAAWFLHGLAKYDGAVREKNTVTMYWASYGQRLAERLKYLPESAWEQALQEFTAMRASDAPDELRRLVKLMSAPVTDVSDISEAAELGGAVTQKLREKLLRVTESHTTGHTFSVAQLNGVFARATSLNSKKRNELLAVARRKPRISRVVTREFRLPDGTTLAVDLKKHAGHWAVRFPLQRAPGAVLPSRIDRVVKEQHLGDDLSGIWWTKDNLVSYAYELEHKLMPEAAGVYSVLNQFLSLTALYDVNRAVFRADLREHTKNERKQQALQNIQDGVDPGSVPLGPLSQAELGEIQMFLQKRDEVPASKPFRGPLTDEEWRELEYRVPLRPRTTLRKRILELGFQYAMATSYVEYLKSGFCIGKSTARRMKWLRAGVPLSRESK